MNSTEHWNAWLRDLTPMEPHLAALTADAEPRCWNCDGTGWQVDRYGHAEPCDQCGDYGDAIAEAVIDNTGYPF
jgi:hypothetical protein